MLEGRGIDFEAIGLARGYARDLRAADRDTDQAIAWAEREQAMRQAQDAGRKAQIEALVDALREIDPGHPALQPTGRVWADGSNQVEFEVFYNGAYDTVAQACGIPVSRRAMTPADQAHEAVMSEPIEVRRFFFSRRFFFRAVEHRSLAGAERARCREAETARRSA